MPEDSKPKPKVPTKDIQKALARGNALWDISGKAAIPLSLVKKIGEVTFDSLSDGEKLLVVKLATSFLRASDEIENTFKEQEEKERREADEAKATEAIEAEEIEESGPSGTGAPETSSTEVKAEAEAEAG